MAESKVTKYLIVDPCPKCGGPMTADEMVAFHSLRVSCRKCGRWKTEQTYLVAYTFSDEWEQQQL